MFIFHNSTGTSKTFTLKFIMQGLLWLYNRSIYFNLTKAKALFMASTSKVTFNVDSLTIHSTSYLSNNPYLVYQMYDLIC